MELDTVDGVCLSAHARSVELTIMQLLVEDNIKRRGGNIPDFDVAVLHELA